MRSSARRSPSSSASSPPEEERRGGLFYLGRLAETREDGFTRAPVRSSGEATLGCHCEYSIRGRGPGRLKTAVTTHRETGDLAREEMPGVVRPSRLQDATIVRRFAGCQCRPDRQRYLFRIRGGNRNSERRDKNQNLFD